jgi:hypothetical protein
LQLAQKKAVQTNKSQQDLSGIKKQPGKNHMIQVPEKQKQLFLK